MAGFDTRGAQVFDAWLGEPVSHSQEKNEAAVFQCIPVLYQRVSERWLRVRVSVRVRFSVLDCDPGSQSRGAPQPDPGGVVGVVAPMGARGRGAVGVGMVPGGGAGGVWAWHRGRMGVAPGAYGRGAVAVGMVGVGGAGGYGGVRAWW